MPHPFKSSHKSVLRLSSAQYDLSDLSTLIIFIVGTSGNTYVMALPLGLSIEGVVSRFNVAIASKAPGFIIRLYLANATTIIRFIHLSQLIVIKTV